MWIESYLPCVLSKIEYSKTKTYHVYLKCLLGVSSRGKSMFEINNPTDRAETLYFALNTLNL
jgi:hypothetical protein